ncbi:MAG: thiamine diphosphokinase [Rhizobiaceae bacterium]
MTLFVILLGGDVTPSPRLLTHISGARAIAADSGMKHAHALGITPELWVGDFDSSSKGLQDAYKAVPRLPYPRDKDQTDGEIAAAQALKLGATRLLFAGAFGGERTDHEFAHLAAAIRLSEAGTSIVLSDGRQEAWPVPASGLKPDLPDGTMFSLLAFGDLEGLTLTGAKWPLQDADVGFGSSLTLSNQVDGSLEVSLKAGRALLLAHI